VQSARGDVSDDAQPRRIGERSDVIEARNQGAFIASQFSAIRVKPRTPVVLAMIDSAK